MSTWNGIDTFTASGVENRSSLLSRCEPTLIPRGESISSKLFEEATFQKMTLDVEGVVDGGLDRQKALGGSWRLKPLLFLFALFQNIGRRRGQVVLERCSPDTFNHFVPPPSLLAPELAPDGHGQSRTGKDYALHLVVKNRYFPDVPA